MKKGGPKPRPTALFAIEGGRRKARANADEPMPEPITDEPPAPPHLPPVAAAEWRRIVPLMMAVNMLTDMDLAPLAAYCQCVGDIVEMSGQMAKLAETDKSGMGGRIISAKSGGAYLNPLVNGLAGARRDMVRYAAELGLTPSSRSGVRAPAVGSKTRGEDLAKKFNV